MGIEVKSARRAGLLWLVLPAVVGLVALACSTGAYPVDIFTEMHYQQSFKSQEPPRLYPPEGSTPFTDESLELRPREPTPAEALAMTSPFPYPSQTETLEHGKQIFIRNCSMCHGLEGRSDTFISVTFTSLDVTPPADFAIAPSITLTASDGTGDGLAFGVITNGLGNMPAFRNLLTYEERWTVIHYLRFLSEQANQ